MKNLLLSFLLTGTVQAASNDDWAARSIYQIITDRYARSANLDAPCNITNYCGGTWAGIAENLDYIQNMGFTAIQISPVNKNLESTTIYGQAFHGYWQTSLYDLNPNFGTADDLKNLSSELHKRDMYLLVDVVASEMAWDLGGDVNMTSTTKIDYSSFSPFNSDSDYNPYCPIINWNNVTEYQDCWLGYTGVATPDLKTQDTNIAAQLGTWVKELVANYSIDGIRVDGAKQINYDFFQGFIKDAGVYSMGEVDDGDAGFTCNYQQYIAGLENYPVYYTIIDAFTAGKMDELVSMVASVNKSCSSPQYLATFVENQDNPRLPTYTDDETLVANALAFTILADGIPKYYYGQEQFLSGNFSPYNRQPLWESSPSTTTPLYTLTSTLNTLRNHAISLNSTYLTRSATLLSSDSSTYATRKGEIVSLLSNQGAKGGDYTLSVDMSGQIASGTNMTEVIGCEALTVGDDGFLNVRMGEGVAKVYFPSKLMGGSGLCGFEKSATATASASGSSTASAGQATATGKKKGGTVGRVGVGRELLGLVLGVGVWLLW